VSIGIVKKIVAIGASSKILPSYNVEQAMYSAELLIEQIVIWLPHNSHLA
jgi:hypothetical protein